MKKTVKHQIVGYKPGMSQSKTPCIKITNALLEKCGFEIGGKIKIIYRAGEITILTVK